ncbi:hypothetical protein GGTG_05312 [Gaeumannomyces tritici R3-111a-1]|uniref:Uncharacterized protein n=1 Tax=Gaeumannomyces tritici (strain R3-111a-1) TaxID=644352 RepID=J3NVJ7_GAET3|nr:hypothetical protein GGTG_05312 [Gaeumannomyces tritici R3-111a-1]EJT75375.1 hypothetical protein GGTG_05312 [Gaeumannomyces tritici R3-111a-1]
MDLHAKTKAEAKKAKEREFLDTASEVSGQANAAKPAKKAEKGAPGSGQISRTSSIGPKVIRGAPKSKTSEQRVKTNKGKAKMTNVGTKPPATKQPRPQRPTTPKTTTAPPKTTTAPPKATTAPPKATTIPPNATPKAITTIAPKATTKAKTSKPSPLPLVPKQPQP